jgi:hypothetical protein
MSAWLLQQRFGDQIVIVEPGSRRIVVVIPA